MPICVFCQTACDPAPTTRGWSQINAEKGLHFDCARKVAAQGDAIQQIEFKPTSTIKIENEIAEIFEKNIKFSAQVGGYVVHGAIGKIIELIERRCVLFGTWYSGMILEKVIRAYHRFCNETGQKPIQEPEEFSQQDNDIQNLWMSIANKFTGLIGTAQYAKAIEELMAEYYAPLKKEYCMNTLTYQDIVTPELLEGAVEHYADDFVRDYHILHCLLKKYKPETFLEIGTHIGTGTKIIKNALGQDSTVYSLDLPAEQADKSGGMHPVSEGRTQAVGSACDLPFKQLYGDSLNFNFSQLGKIKGFFIDGDHDYEHPYKETLAAIAADAKIIIWHDADAPQVWQAIKDAIDAKGYYYFKVEGTHIAVALKPVKGGAFVYTKPNGEIAEFGTNQMAFASTVSPPLGTFKCSSDLVFQSSDAKKVNAVYEFIITTVMTKNNMARIVYMGDKIEVNIPAELLEDITIK